MGALIIGSSVLLLLPIITTNIGTQASETPDEKLIMAINAEELSEVMRLVGDTCTGANVNYRREFDQHTLLYKQDLETPLHIAARHNQAKVVAFLLSCNADPNIQSTSGGVTPLMTATEYRSIDVVHAIMTKNPNLNVQDNEGKTALMYAANPVIFGFPGGTAMMMAIKKDLNITNTLLEYGADIHIQDLEGNTALRWAIQGYGANVGVVKTLIAAGAEVDSQNEWGGTALMQASAYGHVDVIKVLIAAGSQINRKDYYSGRTALLRSTTNIYLNTTLTLLNLGADINIQDDYENTILHYMVNNNFVNRGEYIKVLFQHCADTMIKNKNGETAADIARRMGFMDILQMIEQHTLLNNCIDSTTTVPRSNNTTIASQHPLPVLMMFLSDFVNFLVISMIIE